GVLHRDLADLLAALIKDRNAAFLAVANVDVTLEVGREAVDRPERAVSFAALLGPRSVGCRRQHHEAAHVRIRAVQLRPPDRAGLHVADRLLSRVRTAEVQILAVGGDAVTLGTVGAEHGLGISGQSPDTGNECLARHSAEEVQSVDGTRTRYDQ